MIMRKIGENKQIYIERAAKEMYCNGYHISEIANKLKCDILIIRNAVTDINKYKITTEEERQKMINMYECGYSVKYIAKIFNRNESCVNRRIKSKAKFYKKYKEYKLSDKDINYLKKMYLKGYTLKSICKELGITYTSARRRLIKAGIWQPNLSQKIEVPNYEKNKYRSLYNKGFKVSEIAKKFNRQYCVVARTLGVFDNYK